MSAKSDNLHLIVRKWQGGIGLSCERAQQSCGLSVHVQLEWIRCWCSADHKEKVRTTWGRGGRAQLHEGSSSRFVLTVNVKREVSVAAGTPQLVVNAFAAVHELELGSPEHRFAVGLLRFLRGKGPDRS